MSKTMRFSLLASATVLLLGVTGGAQAQQSPNMSFFVTSAPVGKGGDLGGLAGADAHCQVLAAAVGAGNKTWRAYLSSAEPANGKGINARDRIGNGPWQGRRTVSLCRTDRRGGASDRWQNHSGLMLAALISGHHFSISALWWA